ncbi:MAG TPA: hypothetical protein VFS00_00215 [Polyangiaceae bacterium]|nr:hypothetical protein [Polyangiaceae bacterium]
MVCGSRRRLGAALFWFALASALVACRGRSHLRGNEEPSPDGKTYLAVDEVAFTGCALFLDKKPWPHPLRAAGPIAPGTHYLECRAEGGVPGEAEVGFIVAPGRVFHFSYWGP